jgi:hypothetical protein
MMVGKRKMKGNGDADTQAVDLLGLRVGFGAVDEVPIYLRRMLALSEEQGLAARVDHSIGWTTELRERVGAIYDRDALS